MHAILRLAVIIPLLTLQLAARGIQTESAGKTDSAQGVWQFFADGSLDPCHYTILYSVSMVSPSDGWAVGRGNSLFHWNGNAWLPVSSPIPVQLRAIKILSASDGWAVGETILHWDGSAWRETPHPEFSLLHALDMLSATDGWAVGESGAILHW